MRLREYLKSQDEKSLEHYAERVGTSTKYLRAHVIGGSRGASLKFMRALARESGGEVSLTEVLMHYGVTAEELDSKAA
ncbi:hypothetical protein HME01_22750 [Vreelandella aquamarina]|uniref:Transcriptional regulator n=1 Tax=Vreelandella aquamarina TaxID=77097 RepID=A0A1N6D756_9GAMM|nr:MULTISPECIES: hypothetical protein [Halomonas]MCF2911757.1 hypothetical protein [Halomonas sp. Cn5-12]SIN66484.1 hypothetical protein SAMN05878249_2145 [Halomonas meridiana]SIN79382.1 hypothetical protein SAMN05878438_3581 [Halomonas meridiana]SIO34185.1 hypothetical protein SAMN05878442_2462 [Halomonas meridiana]GED46423.1 hypothetical protein HME01_22750 [Halomonas meridiana]